MQKFLSHSQFQTEEIAERLAKTLHGTEVIAMFGGMGAGKTAFTRGLARGLGINDGVSSPTFALVHEYEGRFPLYHFDMYRIGSFDDLYSTGFFDYIENGVMLIEWSRKHRTLSARKQDQHHDQRSFGAGTEGNQRMEGAAEI